MEAIGTVSQVSNPFWTLTPPANVQRNPLKYHCASNEATPDYVAASNIGEFIAYGFLHCFDTVSPEYFTMWNMVEKSDVQWLRTGFLKVLEKIIASIQDGSIGPGTSENDFDHGQWAETVTIGDHDENGDENEIMFLWVPGPVHEDAFAMVLSCMQVYGEGTGGDDEVIWLRMDALKDKRKVKAAIAKARKVNVIKT